MIRVHSFLLGQIKPSIDQADAFNPSHSTSSRNIPPGAVQQFQGQLLPGCVFISEHRNSSSLGEITPGPAREGSAPLACVTLGEGSAEES